MKSVPAISVSITLFLLISGTALRGQDPSQPGATQSVLEKAPTSSQVPPRTLITGQEQEVVIDEHDSTLEGFGRFETFRYGAVSSGPVTVEIHGEGLPWFIQIHDEQGTLLDKATGAGGESTSTLSVQIEAGTAVRIRLGLEPGGRGTLTITLHELNREEGEKRIGESIRKGETLIAEAQKAWASTECEKARALIRDVLSAMNEAPGFRQSSKAIKFVKDEAAKAAYGYRDYKTAVRGWKLAKHYYEAVRPPDDYGLLATRMYLGTALYCLGRFEEARPLLESVIAQRSRTHDLNDKLLRNSTLNLGLMLKSLGFYDEARPLLKRAVEAFKKTCAKNDPNLQRARLNYGSVLLYSGECDEALAIFDDVLKILKKVLVAHDPDIQTARMNIALCFKELGDPIQAHGLLEEVVDAYLKVLPAEDLDLQKARLSLAETKGVLGDIEGARSIFEAVIEILERNLEKDNEILLDARTALGGMLYEAGEYQAAKKIFDEVIHVYRTGKLEDHLPSQAVRSHLGLCLWKLGDLPQAHDLFEQVLGIYNLELPPDHPAVIWTRSNLAIVEWELGETENVAAMFESVLKVLKGLLPSDHPDILAARTNLYGFLLSSGRRDEAIRLIKEALNDALEFVSRIIRTGSIREIDETLGHCRWILDDYLSAGMSGTFPVEACFSAAEAFRNAGTRAGMVSKIMAAEGGEEIDRLKKDLFKAGLQVASADTESFYEAWRARDKAERALAAVARKLPGAKNLQVECFSEEIAECLPEKWAGISYLRYNLTEYREKDASSQEESIPSYLAFILFKNGRFERVDLGKAAAIEKAATAWRDELMKTGPSSDLELFGSRLKELVWKPVQRRLKDTKNVVLALDAVLATVPLEALPEKDDVLSDHYTLTLVDSLSSLAIKKGSVQKRDEDTLLVFGGIDYDKEPELYTGERFTESVDEDSNKVAFDSALPSYARYSPVYRGDNEVKARFLTGTATEAAAVSEIYNRSADRKALYLKGAEASKHSLLSLAPHARYLHIATHGYFAPDYVRSIQESSRGERMRACTLETEKVRSLAPALLCGIKLAGANLPRKGLEEHGVITAAEIQSMDLSGCELAVLSACETGLGIVRAGQGIISMQRALSIAGARGSITSLWKVDDHATWLLFSEFYRLLWDERMAPPEALRQAKRWLRTLTVSGLKAWRDQAPAGVTRSLQLTGSYSNRPVSYRPYSSPYYWAAFVYCGGLE